MSDQLKTMVEEPLAELRESLPVNQELKADLRAKFARQTTRRKRAAFYRAIVATAAALLLLIGSISWVELSSNRAFAAGMQVVQQFSFLDLTSGSQGVPAVFQQQLYIPLFGQGIAVLDTTAVQSGQGLRLIVEDASVDRVAISHDGRQLAYSTGDGVYLFDLAAGVQEKVVASNGYDVYYQEPSWSQDDQSLFVTKETVEWLAHGHQTKSLEVMQVNLATGAEEKLTDGRSASEAPDGSFLVFERDGQIYQLGLRDASILPWVGLDAGEEKLLCPGRSPSISPDGRLVALVRNRVDQRKLGELAAVEQDIADVYVVNLRQPADEKQLTSNYPDQTINEQDWLAGLPQTNTQQTLIVPGHFSYFSPVWAADSTSVYVLKGYGTGGDSGEMRIMRVSLSTTGLTPSELAAEWLEAVVNRDQDAARQMMSESLRQQGSDQFLSNPHPVGFSLTGTAGQESGREYVDVVEYFSYTASPYFQVVNNRLYFERVGNGYLLQEIRELGNQQVYERDGVVWLEGTGGKQQLCRLDELLKLQPDEHLGSIAYQPTAGQLYMTVQGQNRARIFSLAADGRSVTSLLTLTDAVVVDLSLCADGAAPEFLLINFGDMTENVPRSLLYSLADGMPVQTLGRVTHGLWAGSELVCYTAAGTETVRWLYAPTTGQTSLWR